MNTRITKIFTLFVAVSLVSSNMQIPLAYAGNSESGAFKDLFTKKQLDAKIFSTSDQEDLYGTQLISPLVVQEKGKLNLKSDASEEVVSGSQVYTQNAYGYGTYTIKAKANMAQGMVSSITLADKTHESDTSFERIDVELSADNPKLISVNSYHEEEKEEEIIDATTLKELKSFKSNKYVTYKIAWMPGVIRVYANNKLVTKRTEAVPTAPMQLYLTTYHIGEWEGFVNTEAKGKGAWMIDSIQYSPDPMEKKPTLTTTKMQVKGDDNCRSQVADALEILKQTPWHYNFVHRYVDLIECTETGSGMWVWETPRRFTAGVTIIEDTLQFASAFVHEACHSLQYAGFHEKNPDADVPETIYSGLKAESECLDYQTDWFRRIGKKAEADAYNDALDTKWWEGDFDAY